VNLNTDPTTMQLLFVGSASKTSSIDFQNTGDPNSDVSMTIYAPQSTINFQNSVRVRGALAAKSILLSNSVVITYDGRVTGITSTNAAIIYHDSDWVECTAAPSTLAPESGC
jgi:hypothetical protein